MFKKTKLIVTKEEVSTLKPDGYGKDLKGIYEEFLKAEDVFEFFVLLYVGSKTEPNGAIIEKFKKINFMLEKTHSKGDNEDVYYDFWYGDVAINTSKYGYDRYLCETHDEIVFKDTLEEIVEKYGDSPYYLFDKMMDEGYEYINHDYDWDLIDACGV